VNDKFSICDTGSYCEQLTDELCKRYGPLIGGVDLIKALGYTNGQAFRQAHRYERLGVRVFNVPSRQGKYALTADVANWLATVSLAG
jgi:hypothetical protein